MTGPVPSWSQVRAEEIRALDRNTVPHLLRRLLYAEAGSSSIPLDRIRVGSNVDAPDGGIDAEIEWDGGPERTEFIPGRRVGYQVKTSAMRPGKARGEVLDEERGLKPAIRRILRERGHYVLVCSHPMTPDRIGAMEDKLRETIREAGVATDDDRVHVLDGDQMAQWANRYGGIALWAKECVAPGLAEPFLSWDAWSDRPEHTRSEWVEDGRLQPIGHRLRETIGRPRGLMRIVGPAGIGKSRLTLKALEEPESARLGVMYANEAWTSAEALRSAVRRLALGGLRATVVIDECRGETHGLLAGEAAHAGSRLALITIGDGSGAGTRDHGVIVVGDAPAGVVEGIVRQLVPESAGEDRRRLAWLCEGSPELAVRGARAWFEGDLQGAWTEDDLLGVLAGRQGKAARLLAAFGRIKVRDDPREADRLVIDLDAEEARIEAPSDLHLEQVAEFGSRMTADELREGLEELKERGLARKRGRYLSLEPRAIALPLAAKQWKAWSQSRWDRVLWGSRTIPELRESAARQLALLNRQDVAQEVTRHACRLDSPLDRSGRPLDETQAEVLHALSQIDAWSAAEQIGRVLDQDGDDARIVEERAGYRLVRALGKIAFAHETFETGAGLLMRLAVTENAPYAGDAASVFTGLFPLYLGNTAADGRMRLRALDGMGETGNPRQRALVVRALDAALETDHFSRFPGAETHGVRPALKPWQPEPGSEVHDYLDGCLKQLGRLAIHEDAQGGEARAALGGRMRGLVGADLIESVEKIVRNVGHEGQWWPEAAESLGHYLTFEGKDEDRTLRARVEALINRLQPRDLGARVRFLVTEMPWDFPCGEDLDFEESKTRKIEAIQALASGLVEHPEALEKALGATSGGEQRMAVPFGEALAAFDGERGEARQRLRLSQLVDALERTESTQRNFGVLAGYVRGIGDRSPEMVERFKREAGRSATLARGLPFICLVAGVTAADVRLVVEALQADRIGSPDVECWGYGGVLRPRSPSEVAPLFEALLDRGWEGFGTGVRILRTYVRRSPEKLQALGAQICRTARCLRRHIEAWQPTRWNPDFVGLMEAMLDFGPGDADARTTAEMLAYVVASTTPWLGGNLEKRMIGRLLTEFTEVTWPIVSEAIVSEDGRRREPRWRHMLGAKNNETTGEAPLILSVPEAELWAWCRRHPAHAPLFLAGAVPTLATGSRNGRYELHPILVRLVEEAEDPKGVLRRISSNMYDFTWWGSRIPYWERYEEPLDALRDHPNREIRVWAKRTYRNVVARVEEVRREEEEGLL